MRNALLLLVLSASLAYGQAPVDLDAPATKKVTVKSELERGHSAVFDCALKQSPLDFEAHERCTFRVLDENKQKNTDTDAFVLGAYYETFAKLSSLHSVLQERPDREARGFTSLTQKVRFWFKQFRDKQKEMGIDDKTLCSVLKVNFEVMQGRFEIWDKDAASGASAVASPASPGSKKYRAGIKFLPVGKSLQVLVADPGSPNTAFVGKFILSVDGERGAGPDLQAKLAAVIAKHQDGSPVKITFSDGPGEKEKEGALALAVF